MLSCGGLTLQYIRPGDTNHREYLEKASELARANPQIEPHFLPRIIAGLAGFYVIKRRYPEADRLIREAVAIDRANPMYRILLVNNLQILGRVNRFLERYDEDNQTASPATQSFRAFHSAWRTLQGIETVNMIRKGQIRWLPKEDIAGHAAFVLRLLGVVATA